MTVPRSIEVAIVGGGFTGAAVAYHLAHLRPGISIAVFEPRAVLGGGLAYDDHDPAHRINVPATRMSLVPQDENHFARWLEESGAASDDPGISGRDGALYPKRSVFGRYVASHLDPLLATRRVHHVRSRVLSIAAEGGRWTLATDAGSRISARIAALATTHPPPDVPHALAPLMSDPRLVRDALVPGALADIARDARVVILGTGLTMADVVASLDRQGHRGPITALSRRGLRSRGHAKLQVEPFGEFTAPPPRASALLRKVRRTIREAAARGLSWHTVLDALRAQAQTFWPLLAREEQSRIVRHLRVYWDVHRFRIAPQVEDVLDRRIAEGTLAIKAASVLEAGAEHDHLKLVVRNRRGGGQDTILADHVVVTTGPAHAKILSTQPYLAGLAAGGLVRADHLGLGIACDGESRALDVRGAPQETLFVAGPLARARFGELMGLPQVSAHAVAVAQRIARDVELAETRVRDVAAAK
ncbi:FAD-dependent oxidoreductase [Hyphomicrobium sp.]|uniref:FAD/NAD(P)-binding protein n=1 Tax=Hyphomicrobium sp. TaxID=82 RepID=UPI0025C26FD8|nr:FAD-dependent oxidoreductase [Hyphomicrobium sp.]MCC7253868.1 FAD/NAD(P)-binding protein [Hyphomicrobium sp.]